jgi:hypothetical protein
LFVRFYTSAVEGRSLRSSGGNPGEDGDGGGGAGGGEAEEDEESEEEIEEGKDYSWKKTIMIGPSYQVTCKSI